MPTAVTKQVTLEIPDGFEWRGEYRTPQIKEYYMDHSCRVQIAGDDFKSEFPILYPLPPAAPSLTVTVKDIYGTDNPPIPPGFRSSGQLRLLGGDASDCEFWLTDHTTPWVSDSRPRCSGVVRLQLERI